MLETHGERENRPGRGEVRFKRVFNPKTQFNPLGFSVSHESSKQASETNEDRSTLHTFNIESPTPTHQPKA